jgi:RNA methyltransferase, TrmH family
MAVADMIVSSRANARVKQLRAAFADNAKLSGGLVAIEGEHLLDEALRSGIPVKMVFVSARRDLPSGLARGAEVIRLAEDVLQSAMETRSPQGVAALIEPPVYRLADVLAESSPLILIAAGLQDPGNIGTLVRSAEAFGAAGVLTTPGTVSVWNQKALRASTGSVFRVPVVFSETADGVRGLKQRGVRLLAAVGAVGKDVMEAQEVDLRGGSALMIGNEGAGLGPEWLEMADAKVTIPCPGPVESLNAAVAGSLLLYEASRQRAGSAASKGRR